jgi:hypothetical protein
MKVNESSSGSSSAATSASGPTKPGEPQSKPTGEKPKETTGPLSESEFLAKQAEDARLAMGHAWADLKHSLASGVDVRNWTKQYPWIATSTAMAAGVAAGYLLTPRDKDEFREMWEKLKDKLAGGARTDPNAVYVEPTRGGVAAPQQQPSLLGSIVRESLKSVMPLVTSMLGAAVGGGEAASHNGHGDASSSSSGSSESPPPS